jgi:hypothetical protein
MRGSAARSRESRSAEVAEYHAASKFVAVDCARKFERHRHRVSNGYLPRDFVTIDSAIENACRVSVCHLAALERGAFSLHRRSTTTLAQRRSYYEAPIPVCNH